MSHPHGAVEWSAFCSVAFPGHTHLLFFKYAISIKILYTDSNEYRREKKTCETKQARSATETMEQDWFVCFFISKMTTKVLIELVISDISLFI